MSAGNTGSSGANGCSAAAATTTTTGAGTGAGAGAGADMEAGEAMVVVVGYDFFSPERRTRVITRFFNIIVGETDRALFAFPC